LAVIGKRDLSGDPTYLSDWDHHGTAALIVCVAQCSIEGCGIIGYTVTFCAYRHQIYPLWRRGRILIAILVQEITTNSDAGITRYARSAESECCKGRACRESKDDEDNPGDERPVGMLLV